MAFSLALAGSVMVTVSVVSIGPECLAASSMPKNAQHSSLDSDNSFFIFGITLMPLWSIEFLHRLLSFGAGCLLYFLLSKYAFPDEPEEILANHLEKRNARPYMTLSWNRNVKPSTSLSMTMYAPSCMTPDTTLNV